MTSTPCHCGAPPVYQDALWSEYLCQTHYDETKRENGTIPMAARKQAPEQALALAGVLGLDIEGGKALAAQWVAEAEAELAYVRSVAITTPALEQWAADTDKTIAAAEKARDAEKTARLGPIRDLLNLVTSWWTGPAKIRAASRAELKSRIMASVRAREALAAAAMTEATSVAEVQRAAALIVPLPEGMHTRKAYRAEVVDPTLVPPEFWRIDQAALDALAAVQQDAFAVPGCRVVCDTGLSRNAT